VSLNAHDRHELSLIEEALAGTDPRFAASMSAFSRLAGDEEMPERERIRDDAPRGLARVIRGRHHRGRGGARRAGGRHGPSAGWPGTWERGRWISVTVWLLISAALLSVALALGHDGSGARCAQWQGLTCVRQGTVPAPRVP
jgi:hypothetical protein